MFMPASNSSIAPVTTAVFAVPVTGEDFTAYLANFKCSDPNTVATIGAIVLQLATVATDAAVPPSDLTTNCRKLFRGAAAASIITLCADPAATAVTDNDDNIRAIRLNLPAVTNWLADLINAGKKKTLDADNVEGYFAMLGHSGTKPGAVARLINQIVPFFPDSVGQDAFRALLSPGIWTTYRNTRVSTGIILRALLPDFRAVGITVAGNANEVAIIASAEAPWDVTLTLTIPDKLKAYGCILHEASGTPIDGWFQGNKAKDALPVVRARQAKAIFRKYLEVKNSVTGLDAFTTVAEFATPAVTGFW